MRSSHRWPAAWVALSLLAACSEEEGAAADGGPSLPSLPDATVVVDGGFLPSVGLDASLGGGLGDGGGSGLVDAQQPAPGDASAPDGAVPDASAPDASAPDASAPDASAPDASAPDGGPADAGAGQCNTATPHGCYKAKAGNDPQCPAQMPEQTGFYPPFEEWKGCSSPLYQACVYLRPDGSEANCSCDFGLHWLCAY